MKLVLWPPSGAYNFELVPTFLENVYTSVLKMYLYKAFPKVRYIIFASLTLPGSCFHKRN